MARRKYLRGKIHVDLDGKNYERRNLEGNKFRIVQLSRFLCWRKWDRDSWVCVINGFCLQWDHVHFVNFNNGNQGTTVHTLCFCLLVVPPSTLHMGPTPLSESIKTADIAGRFIWKQSLLVKSAFYYPLFNICDHSKCICTCYFLCGFSTIKMTSSSCI